jgi:short-subunit dehydrogenase
MMKPSKTALISGGSSGLGLAIAGKLGELGYSPLLLARDIKKLEEASHKLQSKGITSEYYVCDVTFPDSLSRIASEVGKKYSKIDFLVINAGVVAPKLLEDKSFEEIEQELNTNLLGAIFSAKVFIPHLKEGGNVLLISSGFGLMGAAGYSVYCASKAGLINFAEALRRELKQKNISVSVACPGDIDTPQYHKEVKDMPLWMKGSKSPRGLKSAPFVANHIIKMARKRQFFILPHFEVRGLTWAIRVLPRKIKDRLLDAMFPLPSR